MLVIMLMMTVALTDEPVHAGEDVSTPFIIPVAVVKTSETGSVNLWSCGFSKTSESCRNGVQRKTYKK